MSRRTGLSRRIFLGGAAATVALPFLESAVPAGRLLSDAARADDHRPTRLVFVHVPNGMIRTKMKPAEEGRGYTMPSLLDSLSDLRDHFSILTGLSNKPGAGYYRYPDGRESNDGPGDHARDTATFLTATRIRKTSGDDFENGISVDQVAANHLREVTPEIPSLELATRSGSYGGDSGYAPVYKSAISWAGPRSPLPKETSPRAVFDRLFAGVDPTETLRERQRRQALEQSVLDYVLDDVRRIEGRLGRSDQRRLDEYLTGVRHLEVRLEAAGGGAVCSPGTPPGEPSDLRQHADLMFELIKLAFSCDRTRVATLMLDTSRTYDFLSVDGSAITQNHHQISHLEGGASDVRKIEEINRWQISAFGDLLRKLQSVTEDSGDTILDNSLVLFGGGLDGTGHDTSDGSLTPRPSGPVHRHTDLPLLLGGRGGGAVDSGRHIVYRDDEPIADLFVSMLHSVGARVDGFGLEGTGPLAQL